MSLAFIVDRKDRISIPGSEDMRLIESQRCIRFRAVKLCVASAWTSRRRLAPVQLAHFHDPFFREKNYAITFLFIFDAEENLQSNIGPWLPAKTLILLGWSSHHLHCSLGFWVCLVPIMRCEVLLGPPCPDSCLDIVGI